MTEQAATSPRLVGGSPAFVAARGIKDHSDLSFPDAYALSKLVLEEGGGPLSCRGKGAVIKKPTETALVSLGLIEVHSSSEFKQRYYIELDIRDDVRDLLCRRQVSSRGETYPSICRRASQVGRSGNAVSSTA
jgi:hypothetical protein